MESSMHTRIRKFNTRDTYPEQQLDNDLCQTVVARGTTVFVRGQVGQDLDTAVNVGVGDAAAQAEAGVVATQNITDPALGPQILRMLAAGATAEAALALALESTAHAAYRQLLVMGRTGLPATHTGSQALGTAGIAMGADCAAA